MSKHKRAGRLVYAFGNWNYNFRDDTYFFPDGRKISSQLAERIGIIINIYDGEHIKAKNDDRARMGRHEKKFGKLKTLEEIEE